MRKGELTAGSALRLSLSIRWKNSIPSADSDSPPALQSALKDVKKIFIWVTSGHKSDSGFRRSLWFSSVFQLTVPRTASLKVSGGQCRTSPGGGISMVRGGWSGPLLTKSGAELRNLAMWRWAMGSEREAAGCVRTTRWTVWAMPALCCDASLTQVTALVLLESLSGEVKGPADDRKAYSESPSSLSPSSLLSGAPDTLRAGFGLELSFSNISMYFIYA